MLQKLRCSEPTSTGLSRLLGANATIDNLDLTRAKAILDEDHYNLSKIKERIIEYLAVRKLQRENRKAQSCVLQGLQELVKLLLGQLHSTSTGS